MNRREFVQSAIGSAVLSSASPLAFAESSSTSQGISLVIDKSAGSSGEFALESILTTLDARHIPHERVEHPGSARCQTILVAGLAHKESSVGDLARQLGIDLPQGTESLVIRKTQWKGKDVLLVCGSDQLGLAYALHDIADRMTWTSGTSSIFAEVQDAHESPTVRDRSLSTYCMQQAYMEKRLFNEDYWAKYLDVMVKNRFNNFTFIFGYESSGFLAPPYAWFFDLPEFPQVKAVGVTKEQQQRYLSALNRLIHMTHERGLKFTLGIWDHVYDGVSTYYTEGVWDHLPIVDGRHPRWPVDGLTSKILIPYTQSAFAHFLDVVPELDRIQFRMHGESGLSEAGLKNFWTAVFKVVAAKRPKTHLDLRAKGLPIDVVDAGLDLGLDLRVVTKFDAEQMGTPFFPMLLPRAEQFTVRAGYADLLTYPQKYHTQWRLFTSGTIRVLLWGDPEYARHFAGASHIYDADGYEVAEPLATKMASKPHNMQPLDLLNPPYRYYQEEFQRYWAFYFSFGRMGYNPLTPTEVWSKQFELHYGKPAAPHIQRALETASGVLPRIIGYSLPASKFPTTRGWPERQRWGDLPEYAHAGPSDLQLFSNFREDAKHQFDGTATAKIRVEESGLWFADRSRQVMSAVAAVEQQGNVNSNKELFSTLVDLKILANLAEYHSRRVIAGMQYASFLESNDVSALDAAIAAEAHAIEAWEAIVQAAHDVYARDLAMGLAETEGSNRPGADLSGSWQDEVPKLKAGLAKLQEQRASFHLNYRKQVGKYAFAKAFMEEGYTLRSMKNDLSLDMPNGFYELQLEVAADPTKPRIWGPMWIEANGSDRTDHFTVKPDAAVQQTLVTEVRQGRLNIMIASESTGDATLSRMTVTRIEPVIAHMPVRKFTPNSNLVLHATVVGEDGIQSVQVYWKTASGKYNVREMTPSTAPVYTLTVPAEDCHAGSAYFITATDKKGRISTYPVNGGDEPISVRMQHPDPQLLVTHEPIRSAKPQQPLRVVAKATAATGVKHLRVRYRSVTQYQDYYSLDMLPSGNPDEYTAEIPGAHIISRFDLMYFFEIFDHDGNGKIFPDQAHETPYIVIPLNRNI